MCCNIVYYNRGMIKGKYTTSFIVIIVKAPIISQSRTRDTLVRELLSLFPYRYLREQTDKRVNITEHISDIKYLVFDKFLLK